MTWHSTVIPRERVDLLLSAIRRMGGTLISSRPMAEGVWVTWTTAEAAAPDVVAR